MDYVFISKKLTFKVCNKFKTLNHLIIKITLYSLQNKINQLCTLLSKIELIKYLFFYVKIHIFRVKNYMLKNEILKKQAKNTQF